MILIESNISYDEFVLVNNVIEAYGAMKETIKYLKTLRLNPKKLKEL